MKFSKSILTIFKYKKVNITKWWSKEPWKKIKYNVRENQQQSDRNKSLWYIIVAKQNFSWFSWFFKIIFFFIICIIKILWLTCEGYLPTPPYRCSTDLHCQDLPIIILLDIYLLQMGKSCTCSNKIFVSRFRKRCYSK